MAASLQTFSRGRLIMGYGAGWLEEEYHAYGYEFPSARVRIAQMVEGIEVMKAMWTEPSASYEGRHFRIDGAQCDPKPVQQPHPPIWIGGGGEKLTLRVVALHQWPVEGPGSIHLAPAVLPTPPSPRCRSPFLL